MNVKSSIDFGGKVGFFTPYNVFVPAHRHFYIYSAHYGCFHKLLLTSLHFADKLKDSSIEEHWKEGTNITTGGACLSLSNS